MIVRVITIEKRRKQPFLLDNRDDILQFFFLFFISYSKKKITKISCYGTTNVERESKATIKFTLNANVA